MALGRERFEESVERAEATLQEGEEFFGIEIERPDYEPIYLGVSSYVIQDSRWVFREFKGNTMYLNPFLSKYDEHESRHRVHTAVVQDVVERNEDAVKKYCAEELADISPVPSGTGIRWACIKWAELLLKPTPWEPKTSRFYDTERTAQLDSEELTTRLLGMNRLTNPVQQEVYAENEVGSERFVNVAGGIAGGALSVAGVNEIYHAGIEALTHDPLLAIPPLGVLVSYRSYQHLKQGHAEPLIDANLEDYNEANRKRAMLYNSRVADNIDDFLEVMNDYEIK